MWPVGDESVGDESERRHRIRSKESPLTGVQHRAGSRPTRDAFNTADDAWMDAPYQAVLVLPRHQRISTLFLGVKHRLSCTLYYGLTLRGDIGRAPGRHVLL